MVPCTLRGAAGVGERAGMILDLLACGPLRQSSLVVQQAAGSVENSVDRGAWRATVPGVVIHFHSKDQSFSLSCTDPVMNGPELARQLSYH